MEGILVWWLMEWTMIRSNNSFRFAFMKQMNTSFKPIFLLALFLVNGFLLFAQRKTDTVVISNYIVKHGYIRSYTDFPGGVSDPSNYIDIITAEDSAFSVSDGIVKAFFKVGQSDFVIIESKDSVFAYGDIVFKGLKKFDPIKKSEFLGLISKSDDHEQRILFSIGFGEAWRVLNYIELFDHLKKYKR